MMLANPILLPATAASSPLPPPPTPPHQISQVFHLRALFDYDPDEDLYIPCRELGICFNKGTELGLMMVVMGAHIIVTTVHHHHHHHQLLTQLNDCL